TPNLTPACGATVTYPTCPGTYNTNELVTWTLCPDAGTYAVIEFTYMDLETRTTDDLCWDQLNVTGVTTEVVCGESDGDGGIGTDFAAGDCLFHPVVDACITVEFDSDGSTNESGFSFVFTCIADPGTLSCARSQGPLPVEFTSFSGSAEDKVNVLNWETASEQNNSHFNIERSLDGINFEKIGTVNGSGNSSEVLNYSFEDDKPVSLAYYRLMQVDFDGEFEYSSTIKIKRELRGLAFGIVSPNPTKGIASIELNTASAGSFRMEMMSVDGRIVSSQTLELTEGLNTHDVDLSSFANGVYMLSISSDEDRIITRIVKSN
ncbi:MAG: T9SS type A sorting domain-containing protein, partial [Saprospiraceae bacterium]